MVIKLMKRGRKYKFGRANRDKVMSNSANLSVTGHLSLSS